MSLLKNFVLAVCLGFIAQQFATGQTFTRSELPTPLVIPWEITYGPDNYLWITEFGGKISRVHPINGAKEIIYEAPDYYNGSPLESLGACFNPGIGTGTLGLVLHPEFINPDSAFIYFVYSYNQGTLVEPQTRFKIKRVKWDATSHTVVEAVDLVVDLPTSYDHLGGRLLLVKQNGIPYLFLSIGDHGLSETNSPDCYLDQSLNPNVQAQNPDTQNGKIHRFCLDGSIPIDNPIPNNSFYTRGHRNPQGLMYNPSMDLIYSIEHGDRTDDELNVLYKGMNYGWKYVRGYHDDHNMPDEAAFIENYSPDPRIENDSLVEAFYAWCNVPLNPSADNADWCTVAPSDGIYYGSTAIPTWHNSLLVVTLKDGVDTDMEMYQFKLGYDGKLAASTPDHPNPQRYFGEDQHLNGRLRDLCISPDGKSIYLINNGGAPTSKITVYTLDEGSVSPFPINPDNCVQLSPNPSPDYISMIGFDDLINVSSIEISGVNGETLPVKKISNSLIDISFLAAGTYFLTITHQEGVCTLRFVKR